MDILELLRQIHGFTWPAQWVAVLPFLKFAPTPLALATLILFIWSFAPAFKGEVGKGFITWLKVNWFFTLLPMITGIVLAVGGAQVASSVAAPEAVQQSLCGQVANLTRYCLPADPVRNAEHWMYTAFTLLSLLLIEALVRGRWDGRFLNTRLGLWFLPLITLFLYGCVYMIGRVAILPGNSVSGG